MNGRKVAVVSRHIGKVFDYACCLPSILQLCDEKRVETVLFSMWSYDHTSPKITSWDIFGGTECLKQVILEFCDVRSRSHCRTLVWTRQGENPRIIQQKFARASETLDQKRAFMAEFEERRWDDCFLILCGETNIVKIAMYDGRASDEFSLVMRMQQCGVSVVLNPVHDYMVRHEMKKKRAALSCGERWVLSVWNMGKVSHTGKRVAEAHNPWTAFYDGEDVTNRIVEAKTGIDAVRVGIITIS